MNSVNCYEDGNRANAYATLEFANTYYLAYRDLPEILSAHVIGLRALDFGCGAGRSTRMLRKLSALSSVCSASNCYTAQNAERNNFLAAKAQLCNNYVMRSTRHVVGAEEDATLGHYSDPPMLVLASLANGPKHGHAMIEDIVRLCGTRLGPGTLYGAIARLEQQGWIEPLLPEERRRPYRITAEGVRVLRAKLTTLRQFTKAGLRRLEAL